MQKWWHYILKAHYIRTIELCFNILILDLIHHRKHDQMYINAWSNYKGCQYKIKDLLKLMFRDYNIQKVEFFSYQDVLELLR